MPAEDQPAAPDATGQPEPEEKQAVVEQPTPSSTFEAELFKTAQETGHVVGIPEGADASEEPEEPDEKEEPEEVESEEPEEAEEKQPVAAKKGEEWPQSAKQRVAEETDKRRRANERAERADELAVKAQARIAELEGQLSKVTGPAPTEEQPFLDVQDVGSLDRLERSYENAIDLADDNPDELVKQYVEKNGEAILDRFTPEQIVSMVKRKSERALRRGIPERRKYLEQRAANDQAVIAAYPELKKPDSEFCQAAAYLVRRVLTGEAQNDPTLLVWVARALKGAQLEAQNNGGNADADKIIASSKQKIAPSPIRSRSLPERRTTSSDLVKATKKLEERGDANSAEEYVAALFSQRGSKTKRIELLPD